MNCREANRLLPLWIGRDLADASDSDALQAHVTECRVCSMRQRQLQESLDVLQSISTITGATETRSLWPRLALALREMPRRRDHFNGWIPATAMALAATLMVAVSVVQVQREMGMPANYTTRNLFETDQEFAIDSGNRLPGQKFQVPVVAQPVSHGGGVPSF